jgi:hypothetical protein
LGFKLHRGGVQLDVGLCFSSDVLPFEMLPCSDVPSGDESTKSCRRTKQPRWRKKFLAAGLFSDYYKEDEYVQIKVQQHNFYGTRISPSV